MCRVGRHWSFLHHTRFLSSPSDQIRSSSRLAEGAPERASTTGSVSGTNEWSCFPKNVYPVPLTVYPKEIILYLYRTIRKRYNARRVEVYLYFIKHRE
jgi:hypothetical protein